jgi:alpha-1,3-mannosyltransferase
MKILQVTRQFYPSIGGIQNVVYGLAKTILDLGIDVKVVTLNLIFNTGELVESESCFNGIKIHRIPYFGTKRYPVAIDVINRIDSSDILHVHAIDFFVDFLSFTRFLHRKAIIVTTHGGIFHTKWMLPLKQIYFKTFTRMSLSFVDAVVCNSKHDYDLFKVIVPKSKLHVIDNGVDVEKFHSIKKEISCGLLLGIGRVAENKQIEKLISLLPNLIHQCKDIRLIWIGVDVHNKIPEMMELANKLGVSSRVKFLGEVSDQKMRKLLSKAHFFVSAASYEAFGVSTIEAMSSATVPIVTAVGVHPEVVVPGETGFISEFDGDRAIKCFKYALSLSISELERIGENAREITLKYSWKQVVQSYISIYESVLASQTTPLKESEIF